MKGCCSATALCVDACDHYGRYALTHLFPRRCTSESRLITEPGCSKPGASHLLVENLPLKVCRLSSLKRALAHCVLHVCRQTRRQRTDNQIATHDQAAARMDASMGALAETCCWQTWLPLTSYARAGRMSHCPHLPPQSPSGGWAGSAACAQTSGTA